MSRPSVLIHRYYNRFPENRPNVWNNAVNISDDTEHILIPYNELKKLVAASDYFATLFDDGIPHEDFILTRGQLGIRSEVFRWLPWVFQYYGIKVEDPIGGPYDLQQILTIKAKNYIRFLVDLMGFDEGAIALLYSASIPRTQKTRRYLSPKRTNSNSSNNSNMNNAKSRRKRNAKRNIRGLHPLEAKYW